MKGLLIKDFQLLKKQKLLVVLSVFISIIFLLFNMNNFLFIIGYITVMFSFSSTTTIVYDQHTNGMSFLLTLPVRRSDYAKEKYFLMFFVTAVSMAASLALFLVGVGTNRIPYDPDLLAQTLLASALWSAMVHAVMIPIQLKYEAEKSRLAFIVVIGIVYAIVFGSRALAMYFSIDIAAVFARLVSRAGTTVLALILCLAVAGILGISFLVSLHIMKKKEY